MKKKIGIIMAMRGEADPLIDHFQMKPLTEENTILFFSNHDNSIILSLNGISDKHQVDNIGTQPAALNAYILGTKFKPDLIINAGTAGGFRSQGAEIGDVYIGGDKFVFHDRRIHLPGFYEYGIGSYPAVVAKEYLEGLKIKRGIISTGNSLDSTQKDIQILSELNASVKDMEAASVAWVCTLLKMEFVAVKAITDLVDQGNVENDFLKNFEAASKNLKNITVQLIKNVFANH